MLEEGLLDRESDYSLSQNESKGHNMEQWHIAKITIK